MFNLERSLLCFHITEREAESDIDSEEENAIMKEIKEEITKKVKQEMKGELAVMKNEIEASSGANQA